MNAGKHRITPLAAVVGGLLAGTVGTACLDLVNYVKDRRTGGKDSPLAGNSRRSMAGTRHRTRGRSASA